MRSERQWEPKSYRTLRLSFPLSKTGGCWKVFSRKMTWFICLWKGTSSCMRCRETGMDLGGIFTKKEVTMILTWLVSDKEVRMGSRYGNVLKLQRTGWLRDQIGVWERKKRDRDDSKNFGLSHGEDEVTLDWNGKHWGGWGGWNEKSGLGFVLLRCLFSFDEEV